MPIVAYLADLEPQRLARSQELLKATNREIDIDNAIVEDGLQCVALGERGRPELLQDFANGRIELQPHLLGPPIEAHQADLCRAWHHQASATPPWA